MNRRIKSVGSYQQRKKNIHDPLVNPPKFFRQVGDEKGVSIQKLAKKMVKIQFPLILNGPIQKGEGQNNVKVEKMYEKEINQKKKVLDAKKKQQMKAPPRSETESFFALEEMKGTESRPIAAGGEEFSKEEQDMYNLMKDDKRAFSDVVSSIDDKIEIEYIK